MAPTPPWAKIRDTLTHTVRRAGGMLKRHLHRDHQITYKSEIDLVTEMDRGVEKIFIRAVQRFFPGQELLSEELWEGSRMPHPKQPARSGMVRWIVDPLDGTTNYAHGFPHFSVSAGIEYNGRIRLGAVYNPMLNEFFFAETGKGAWCNGKPIRVSTTRRLKAALLATGFPYDFRTSRVNNIEEFKRLSEQCQAVRRAGSASLDLCDVGCGRFDGFWEYKLKPWDVAAASLIISEAGGRITNFSGHSFSVYGGAFIASNRVVHGDLARALKAKPR
ncbi:inositol monophosphatase [candidate division FCPU426 bacterium]|nr:inositol monophosphatase [candidate division FCPU426 bacterium]